jgi:hypothetical protein
VNKRKAPATISALSAAALALGAWSGPASGSADVTAPCPELASHTDASLHEILSDDDISSSSIRTLKSTADKNDDGEQEDLTNLKSDLPRITTRLPGVSSSDSPRFRRHMYRTDI